jgi:GT2 family glycosyltransferase/glycosyltransferase involved in cell wall biosynthesis
VSVLVVSWDRVGGLMAGSAVRALEVARSLAAAGHDAVLAAPDGSECESWPRLRLARCPADEALAKLIAAADVVVLPGRVELMSAVKKPLVVDLYDPFILSNLDLLGGGFARAQGRPLLALRWLQHHLANGDFFLCASQAQRGFWLGMLAAAGRINRANYERDPELRELIDVVPFGLPDAPPVPGAPAVKGVVPGIGPRDRVVLWAGGMWNWVDPLTLVRAQALLRERRPDVKTLVLGSRHPNPEIGEMAVARRAIELADALGLRDRGVSFVDWVPYDDRHRYLLECDVGVSLHRSGVESEFAFRTRILDYLWALRPMVVTVGDDLAARIEREGLGRAVAPEDPEALAAAIEAVLDDPEPGARAVRLEAARASFAWSRVIGPLERFCAAPRHAPDHAGGAWVARWTARDELPRKEDALIADEFLTDARALSPPLGASYAPVQRFRAVYDGLCRIDVLMWVEPPVSGANLLFELSDLGDGHGEEPLAVARVVVPVGTVSRADWQRFEFRPMSGSRGRELEFRLSLVPAGGRDDGEPRSGRVSVWRCAPPPGEHVSGDGVGFIARYLVPGVVEEVPAAEDSFLFLHGATVPMVPGADASAPFAVGEAPAGLPPSTPPQGASAVAPSSPGRADTGPDSERLHAELARVAAQAAAAEQRVSELESRILATVDATARASAAAQLESTLLTMWVLERVLRTCAGLVRLASRVAVWLVVAFLALLLAPFALVVGLAIAVVDGAASVRGFPRGARSSSARARAASAGESRLGVRRSDPVSIVVPTWNGRELLEMSLPPLLEAVRRHGHPDDEILVIDNGSDDGSREAVLRLADDAPALRIVALEHNEGFAGAANRGAREARSPALILLNNDMVVEPDFVQPLLDAFAAEPEAFGVSCQIDFIDPSKERWETGKVHARLEHGSVRLFHLDRFDEDIVYPVFFAGGGASAYDRAKFVTLGGFDEEVFSPVYIEDVDLGYRAWKRGWPSVIAPRSRVHHKHRSTTRRLWSEGRIHSFFVKNLAALMWKNVGSRRLLLRHLVGLPLVPVRVRREQGGRAAVATCAGLVRQLVRTMRARWREAAAPRILADEDILHLSRYRHAYRARFHAEDRRAGQRPQVLVVSPYSPWPAVHGGATRISNLLAEMRDSCDVTLVSFYDTEIEASPESLGRLRELCRETVLVPREFHGRGGRLLPNATVGFWSQRMFDEVEYQLDRRRFDVVQVDYTHMAHYLPAPVPGLLRVLVEHDIAFVAVGRARGRARSFLRRVSARIDELRMLRYEVAAVEGADLVLTMSDADRAALARFVDPSAVRVVPNGVSCRDFPARHAPPEPATILFVGFFRHDPNVEAVEWFAREILPVVRERIPDAIFRVVGAYPPVALGELASSVPGMELTGMVPATAPHYCAATVFVAPILRGSGTRLKILEAMASGCPVVSTSLGAEGLAVGREEIRIADDARAFAEAVVELIERPEEAAGLTARARRFVEERYDWPAIARRLLALYRIEAGAGDETPAADDLLVASGGGKA